MEERMLVSLLTLRNFHAFFGHTFHSLSTEFSVWWPPLCHVSRINLSAHTIEECVLRLSTTTCESSSSFKPPSSCSSSLSSLPSTLSVFSSYLKLFWK